MRHLGSAKDADGSVQATTGHGEHGEHAFDGGGRIARPTIWGHGIEPGEAIYRPAQLLDKGASFIDTFLAGVAPGCAGVAEDEDGSFGLLPNHIDFVTALVPGLLVYEDERGEQSFLAIDRGILVKRRSDVFVSTRRAMESQDLSRLRLVVEEQFRILDERDRKTRAALARLEASFVQRFLELEKPT